MQIPDTSMIQVVFGLGFGTAPTGSSSPIAGKMLALHGDGDATMGPPNVLTFDQTFALSTEKLITPTDTEIQALLTSQGPQFGKHLVRPLNLQPSEDIYRVAPVPAYLVYDGLLKNLSAAEVYERLLLSAHRSPMLNHARTFCRAILVGPLRKNDPTGSLDTMDWLKMPSREAKTWRKHRIEAILPTLFPPTPPMTPPNPPITPPTVGITNTTPNITNTQQQVPPPPHHAPQPPSIPPITIPQTGLLGEAILQQLLLALQNQNTHQSVQLQEEKKTEDSTDSTSKISTLELHMMKRMCGFSHNVDESQLPHWYTSLFRKHQDEKDKDLIISEALNIHLRYEYELIPIYPELRKMIRTRNWTGGETGSHPSYPFACLGLTIFAMIDFSEQDRAQMEFDNLGLMAATHITAEDVKTTREKLKAKIPEDGIKWLSMIMKLTNLLRCLFFTRCPLYERLAQTIKAIRNYPNHVIANLPLQAKAAIFWIIHLQCRHFAQGLMYLDSPQGELLPAFSFMITQISSAQIHMVSCASTPAQLLLTKRKDPPGGPSNPKNKRQKEGDSLTEESPPDRHQGPWNKMLKEQLAGPLKQANYPSMKQICRFCQLPENDTVVQATNKQCRQYLIFGRCRFGKKCRFAHETCSDEQATLILEKFKPFLEAPEEIGKK